MNLGLTPLIQELAAIQKVWTPDNYPNKWFEADDIKGSLGNAIIIHVVAQFQYITRRQEALEYRDLLLHTMLGKAFRTKNSAIVDLVSRAAGMVLERMPVGSSVIEQVGLLLVDTRDEP